MPAHVRQPQRLATQHRPDKEAGPMAPGLPLQEERPLNAPTFPIPTPTPQRRQVVSMIFLRHRQKKQGVNRNLRAKYPRREPQTKIYLQLRRGRVIDVPTLLLPVLMPKRRQAASLISPPHPPRNKHLGQKFPARTPHQEPRTLSKSHKRNK